MYIAYVNRSNGERDNYPHLISLMRVDLSEVMITFIDASGVVNTRRLKVDIDHEIEIYV